MGAVRHTPLLGKISDVINISRHESLDPPLLEQFTIHANFIANIFKEKVYAA